ncbi:hypothetical protein JB92DRAFT_3246803 [Gautieria morchelliformis]|nr:hypothetical protein JB92DRAFT_3246803 [Gautieria morchelliformis]
MSLEMHGRLRERLQFPGRKPVIVTRKTHLAGSRAIVGCGPARSLFVRSATQNTRLLLDERQNSSCLTARPPPSRSECNTLASFGNRRSVIVHSWRAPRAPRCQRPRGRDLATKVGGGACGRRRGKAGHVGAGIACACACVTARARGERACAASAAGVCPRSPPSPSRRSALAPWLIAGLVDPLDQGERRLPTSALRLLAGRRTRMVAALTDSGCIVGWGPAAHLTEDVDNIARLPHRHVSTVPRVQGPTALAQDRVEVVDWVWQ